LAIIVLLPGDTIKIQFADSDGEFAIAFTEERITIDVGCWYDAQGRKGIVYEEIFGHGISDRIAAKLALAWPVPESPER
jgi:hypothetical protein